MGDFMSLPRAIWRLPPQGPLPGSVFGYWLRWCYPREPICTGKVWSPERGILLFGLGRYYFAHLGLACLAIPGTLPKPDLLALRGAIRFVSIKTARCTGGPTGYACAAPHGHEASGAVGLDTRNADVEIAMQWLQSL